MQDEKSLSKVIIFNMVRMLIIFVFIVGIYSIARIMQSVMGREIIMEEEIVIIHEHTSQEAADKAMQESPKKERRGARDKQKAV
jgi:CBS domain-containing protein